MNRNAYTPHYSRPCFTALEQLQGLGHITSAYPQGIWISRLLRGKLGCRGDCLTDVFLQPVQRHIVVEGFDAAAEGCGRTPLRCRRFSATFRRNILGSRSHTADRGQQSYGQPERKDARCPSCCYALIACAALRQHTFFHRILYFFIL